VSSNINASCLKYEELPTKAEQRALKSRREWMAHHVDDVSQMFSKLSISPADIQTLLHTIESGSDSCASCLLHRRSLHSTDRRLVGCGRRSYASFKL